MAAATMRNQTQPPNEDGAYPPATERANALWDLRVPKKGRMLAVGMTESGKSTLSEKLISMWLEEYGKKARVLILDSKPRFRAQWRIDGWPADYLYKQWSKDHGSRPFEESVLVDLNHIKSSLGAIWHQKIPVEGQTRVAVAQGRLTLLPWLQAAANVAYDMANSKWELLVYADEFADYYGTSGTASRGDPLLQIIRSGREKHVAFLAASQRPRAIPKSALTEITSAAVFAVAYSKDLDHLQEVGFPDPVDYWKLARNPHSFYYFNRKAPNIRGYYRWERGQ